MTAPTLTQSVPATCVPAGELRPRSAAGTVDRYDPGPAGYLRPDVAVLEEVSDRLSDDDEVDARGITVTVFRGQVRLEGTVADRHCKRRAARLAAAVTGVREVVNRLWACKTWLHEWSDVLRGNARHGHRGYAGSGTHNAPRPTWLRTSLHELSQRRRSQFATL